MINSTYGSDEVTASRVSKKQKQPAFLPGEDYSCFSQLDGTHPWMEHVPEGFITYQVRRLNSGQVAYFNFGLAKEMGLVNKEHPHKLNRKLQQSLIDCFSLRIINEYDIENNIKYPAKDILPNRFMATRYLQLQHPDKRGLTSGDGRCVWNGTIEHRGVRWDISSRGTGVTALAPGVIQAGHSLESGNEDFGYGCGLAEIDELYASAIMSEVFHLNGLNTERMLCIIDLGGGIAIGVRAGKNLIRPAHLFMHLKQENWSALKRSTDYLIRRQFENKEWSIHPQSPKKYDGLLEEIAYSFAKFAAQLEREYVFAWLDWDGDNVLANAGIIDYGSIRQFGLRHDQYRYDDVERYSTTLNEQKQKARLTVQVFAQLVDYIKTKEKQPLKEFDHCDALRIFDEYFAHYILDYFLYQTGFTGEQRKKIFAHHLEEAKDFYDNFLHLEQLKVQGEIREVADGVNKPPLLNVRKLLAQLPNLTRENDDLSQVDAKAIHEQILADYLKRQDRRFTRTQEQRINKLLLQYQNIVKLVVEKSSLKRSLTKLEVRSQQINRQNRLTGNALLHIVGEIMSARKEGFPHSYIQTLIEEIVQTQDFSPDRKQAEENIPRLHKKDYKDLYSACLSLVREFNEDI